MGLQLPLTIIFVVLELVLNCSKLRKLTTIPKKIRINESDIQKYQTEDDWKPIRIHVDWSHFDDNVPQTNKVFAKAIKDSIIPRTMKIFEKIVKVRRLIKPLKFPNLFQCDSYKVPSDLRTQGVNADLVLYPVIEKTGMFLSEGVEAAALACAQSSLDNRPLMGFIEYRPNLLAGDDFHIDYHIWLSIHELTHVFVFNDYFFDSFVNPHTLKRIPKKQVMKSYTVNGRKMNFIVTKKIREIASKHFNCPNAIGVPLENKGSPGTRDGHWNRKAMNGDVMIGKSFGENLISDITLALFEDSGWYKVDYDMSNIFVWGKNRGCDFLYCKDCFSKREINLKKEIFNIKSKYPREFCSNFNNPVCSTHNIFRGSCKVNEGSHFDYDSVKVMPFTDKTIAGTDIYMDYCPIAIENRDFQLYYGGSCRLGISTNLEKHEKVCPNCACIITDIDPIKAKRLSSIRKIRRGQAKYDSKNRRIVFRKAPNLKASCIEYNCQDGELYVSILGRNYLCNERYKDIPQLGVIKCPLKAIICHPKYKCKFGCVEKFHENK